MDLTPNEVATILWNRSQRAQKNVEELSKNRNDPRFGKAIELASRTSERSREFSREHIRYD